VITSDLHEGLDWQSRRREFNHDWLKNRFTVALNSWLRLLDGAIEDSILEQSFVPEVLPQWEARHDQLNELVRDFEMEMSPRRLFREPPLSRCDEQTKLWLGDLIHRLWLSRVAVRELASAAHRCVSAADAAYGDISQAVKAHSAGGLLANMRSQRQLFARFRDACQELGTALSEFPHEIEVV
jgi:hypothetical protein